MQKKFKDADKLGLKTPYFMTITTRMYKDALSTQIQENKLEAEVTKTMEDDNLGDATKYMKMLENNLKSQELVSTDWDGNDLHFALLKGIFSPVEHDLQADNESKQQATVSFTFAGSTRL